MTNAKKVPVREYMSTPVLFARSDESIHAAHTRMQDGSVRQLPVLENGAPVGLLSQRDLLLLEHLPRNIAENIPVSSVMERDFYTVESTVPVDVVARTMSKRKLGAAIVVDGGRALGVFTTIDALRALSDSLSDSLPDDVRASADSW
jgi:acetoin utilization protein AcuB